MLYIRVQQLMLANSLVYPERIHRGIEWTSVFETSVLCSLLVGKFSNFIQYSTEEYSTVQVLANSLVYPERIQRGKSGLQFLKRLSVCLFVLLGKFSHFPLSTFSFYTVQYRRV